MSRPWGSWNHGIFWVLTAAIVKNSVVWDVTELYLFQRNLLPKDGHSISTWLTIWHHIPEDRNLKTMFLSVGCAVFFLSFFFFLSFILSFSLFWVYVGMLLVSQTIALMIGWLMNDERAEENHKQSLVKISSLILCPSNYMCILTMTTEASCHVHVHIIGVRTNNSILIIRVVFIVATPSISHL
jgi:hypothetical protein